MNRIHPKPGREFILALGMVLGLGVSPVAALPSTPAAGIGGSSGVAPVNRAIFAGDLDAANRLTGLGERYIEQHALAEPGRSEEHTSELQSRLHLVCRLLLEKKKKKIEIHRKYEHEI